MAYEVTLTTLVPRILAAVRKRVDMTRIGLEAMPALDMVWAFLKANPDLRADGHNIFLYHHETPALMPIDFGVEVTREFEPQGDIICATTPSGEAVQVTHWGPYEKLKPAHQALRQWCNDHKRRIGRYSLEIYGDWNEDPAKLETTVQYILVPETP